MRASEAERGILSLPRYHVWARLSIRGPGGTVDFDEVNMSDLLGRNPLFEATWGEDLDQPCASGTIKVARKVMGKNLSPLITMGPNNLAVGTGEGIRPVVWPGNTIKLETSCDEPGMGPNNWKEVLKGPIDEVDVNSDDKTIALTVRDQGAQYIDTWIEDGFINGQPGGTDIQTILGGLIEKMAPYAYGGDSVHSLLTLPLGFTPDWMVNQYTQEPMSYMDALRAVALQLGCDFRLMYADLQVMSNWFTPVLFLPDRDVTTVHATIGKREYFSLKTMPISRADVRNRIRVRFFDKAAGQWDSAWAEDIDSQVQYGPRFMQLAEDQSGNIDTMFEASNLANLALADLKDPTISHSAELRYWWPVQLNDVHTYLANEEHYDTDLTLSIASFQHTLSATQQRTTLGARGKPAAALRNWFAKAPRTTYVHGVPPSGPAKEHSIWVQVDPSAIL